MASEGISYDKAELRSIIKAFKAMDDEAIDVAKEESSALATFVQKNIFEAAGVGALGAKDWIHYFASARKDWNL